jgi:ferredoxin
MKDAIYSITIDGRPVEVSAGQSVLDAARKIGLDIPTLCFLEKCGPLTSCLVCLVKVKGKLVPSCAAKAEPGMAVESETVEVHEARRTALELLFSDHLGDCLSPCHRLCPLRMNIPVMLRQVQTNRFDEAIVTVKNALPMPAILGRLCHHPCEQGCRRANWDDPAAIRDLECRVADEDLASPKAYLPARQPLSGKSVVIVGAGPTGLAAAYFLLREGHSCVIADRQSVAGGTLRQSSQTGELPHEILQAEIEQLQRLGLQLKLGVALGPELTLEGLLRGFNAVLLATGEISKSEGEALGLETTTTGIKVHPDTFETSRKAVFAAGRAIKPMSAIIKAMADGQAAAYCINQFLLGEKIQKAERPFSSVMGKLDKEELDQFMRGTDLVGRAKTCELCATFSRKATAVEASRCLHCDCRSSGDCALQFYAQVYEADASRYRTQRRRFEQHVQPGGIVFEPGKCILCGICVKLTEMAREPLGLTFIGRGFDVRVAAPFDKSIQEGLRLVARECVEHCPTGALAFEK